MGAKNESTRGLFPPPPRLRTNRNINNVYFYKHPEMRFGLRERRTEVGQKLLKTVLKPESIKEVGGTMSVQSSTCLPAHH